MTNPSPAQVSHRPPATLNENRPTPVPAKVDIDLEGLSARIYEVPAGSGRFSDLAVVAKALFWITADPGGERRRHLMAMEIANKDPKPIRVIEDITGYEVSADGKKMLAQKREDLYVVDAGIKVIAPADLPKAKVDLAGWTFPIDVREDWKQIFVDAWRMERDYFYDRNMHGVDWAGVLKRHLPLVDRITTREELSDLAEEEALLGESAESAGEPPVEQPGESRERPLVPVDPTGDDLGAHRVEAAEIRGDEAEVEHQPAPGALFGGSPFRSSSVRPRSVAIRSSTPLTKLLDSSVP